MKYLKSPENHTCKINQANIAIRQGCTIKSVWITHWCSQHPLLVQKLESITNCVIRSHLHNWSPQKKSKEKLCTLALSPLLSFKTWYICGTACLRTHMYEWTIFWSLRYQDEEEKKYLKTANFKGQEQNEINILHENWGAREALKLCIKEAMILWRWKRWQVGCNSWMSKHQRRGFKGGRGSTSSIVDARDGE